MDTSTAFKRDNRSLSSLDSQDTQIAIVMVKKKEAGLPSRKYVPKAKTGEFIASPQKIAPPNLTTLEEQLEKISLSPDQNDYNLHPSTGAYSFPYCSVCAVITDIPNCLPSGNPIADVKGFRNTSTVDEGMGDLYD